MRWPLPTILAQALTVDSPCSRPTFELITEFLPSWWQCRRGPQWALIESACLCSLFSMIIGHPAICITGKCERVNLPKRMERIWAIDRRKIELTCDTCARHEPPPLVKRQRLEEICAELFP